MNLKRKIIFLVGPTAIGKSSIAIKLAKRIKAEIISCDSMQIYKELNIASDKPTKKTRAQIPHHLIDIISVENNYNVSNYRKQVLKAIDQIHKKDKIPIIVGGSGLYMKVLLDGIFSNGESDKKIRAKLYKQAKKYGNKFLYKRLKKIDKMSAKKIHPNDLRRIIRALEVYETTKAPISKLQKNTNGLLKYYDVRIFGLELEREKLYERINSRVDRMFKKGLVAEVKKVLNKKLSKTAKGLIGVKEVKDFLDSKYSKDEAIRLVKRNTRHYAKRQLTWFRKEKRIKWIPINEQDNATKISSEIIYQLK